jgi:DNA-binding winged helix-turn-helix (wHTH) protein
MLGSASELGVQVCIAYRFDAYEARIGEQLLLYQGERVKIQALPFRMLLFLLKHPGQLISREQLRKELWEETTFVDFSSSMRVAATKLREALRDSAIRPRFIETEARRGYRFVADVTMVFGPTAEISLPSPTGLLSESLTAQQLPVDLGKESKRKWMILGIAFALFAGFCVISLSTIGIRGARSLPAVTGSSSVSSSIEISTVDTIVLISPSDPSTIQPDTPVTLTATVTGAGGTTAPTGLVLFAGNNAPAEIQLVPSSVGATSTATFTYRPSTAGLGELPIFAEYLGDAKYNGSASNPLAITGNDPGDFSLVTGTPNLTLRSGQAGTAAILISSFPPFIGAVNLSCVVAGKGTPVPLCSVPATETVALSGSVTATLQIQTSIPASGSQSAAIPRSDMWATGGGVTLACVFLIVSPSRRRKYRMLFAAMFLFVLSSGLMTGCGGNSTPPSTPKPTLVSSGAYTAVVTASNGTTTHDLAFTIEVQ